MRRDISYSVYHRETYTLFNWQGTDNVTWMSAPRPEQESQQGVCVEHYATSHQAQESVDLDKNMSSMA